MCQQTKKIIILWTKVDCWIWPVSPSEGVIQNSSRWRCAKVVCCPGVEGGANALLDNNEDQLGLKVWERLEGFDQLRYLVLLHHLQLAIGHTITIHHNLVWQVVVYLEKRTGPSVTWDGSSLTTQDLGKMCACTPAVFHSNVSTALAEQIECDCVLSQEGVTQTVTS